MDEDFAALMELLNARRPRPSQPFQPTLRKVNLGTLSKQDQESTEASKERTINHHLAKYLKCGQRCFDNIRRYYSEDFQLLRFPLLPVRACHQDWPGAVRCPRLEIALLSHS